MKRLEVTNTFQEGMVMDFNPLTTPNNVVTNCLNGTLITFNGNEYVLLNDMGNGRVETAYLPEGYIPLGTAELGGVIYIVSYNPLKNKCQIGSFPSPERNITSDEIGQISCTLSAADFKVDENKGALVYYLKKNLNEDLVFNPGDKFIVYGDKISDNYKKLYNESSYTKTTISDALQHTLKISLGTITSSGQLVTFDNLKKYSLDKNASKKYHVMQYEGPGGGKQPDLDDYRSITEQPYNVFSSKISGNLVLIAELVQFNQFDIELFHEFSSSASKKTYTPNVKFNFSGSYPFIPKGVRGKFKLIQKGQVQVEQSYDFELSLSDILTTEDFLSYSVPVNDFLSKVTQVLSKISELANSGYFDKSDRDEEWVLQYELIPCMNWGQVSYLAVSGLIDLDKLGTGYIGLNSWRYYNESSKCSLTWGLDIYEEEGYGVDRVEMEFTRLLSESSNETITYSINKKSSYFGVFYDLLPLGQDYYRLSGKLHENLLYLAKIKVYYDKVTSENSRTVDSLKPRVFYRWLYTSPIFNSYYPTESDFLGITLSFLPSLSMDHSIKLEELSQSQVYGVIIKDKDGLTEQETAQAKSSKTSLSGIQTEKKFDISCNLSIGVKNSYDMFEIVSQKEAFTISPLYEEEEMKVDCSDSSKIRYTEREDPNLDTYLKSESKVVEQLEYNSYKLLNSDNQDKSDSLLDTPTNIVKMEYSDITVDSFKDNVYSFKLRYNTLLLVKAYCTKVESNCIYQGKVLPLAYDTDSFDKYNLEFDNGKWVPKFVGTYGFHESGGKDGHVYIGRYLKGEASPTSQEVRKANDVSLNWTTDAEVAAGEVAQGWTGPAMFSVHWNGGGGSRQTRWSNGKNFSEAAEEYTGTSAINRTMLMFRSDKGDLYYYPIDFSESSALRGVASSMISNTTFRILYNNFAIVLNNLYRYEPETFTVEVVKPHSIYYMDDCTYQLSIFLSVNSTEQLSSCKMNLRLDEGVLELSKVIASLESQKVFDGEEDYEPSLENNIKYDIQPLVGEKFTFVVEDTDRTSGITMRNKMEDSTGTSRGLAIMDYNGKDIVKEHVGTLQKSKLYVRNNQNNIVDAREFDPIVITYSKQSDNSIKVTSSSTKVTYSQKKVNLNTRFTLNEEGLLILKSPVASEVSFKRNGDNDTGKVDGYLNAYLLSNHRHY